LRNPLREICTVGSVRGEIPGGHSYQVSSTRSPIGKRITSPLLDGILNVDHRLPRQTQEASSQRPITDGGFAQRFYRQCLG